MLSFDAALFTLVYCSRWLAGIMNSNGSDLSELPYAKKQRDEWSSRVPTMRR